MSIESCLASLVNNAKITQKQADDAKAIYYERLNDDLFRDMGQAEKEAAAALRTAKFLNEDARNAKLAVKQKVDTWRANTKQIDSHPVRPLAGHNAMYDRDAFNRAPAPGSSRENLAGIQDMYRGILAAKLNEFVKAYEPKVLGLRQDTHGIRNWAWEVLTGAKGESGDPVAAATARAHLDTKKFADVEGKRLDPRFRPDPENVLPQYWESERALKFGTAEHKADLMKNIDSGGLRIFDKEMRAPAKNAADRERIVDRAVRDIRMDLSHFGDSTVMSDFSRTFRFTHDRAGAEAYLSLMDKYGAGQGGYFTAIQRHYDGLARELALKRKFGPNPEEQTKHLLQYALRADAERAMAAKEGDELRTWLTGRSTAINLQKMATGQLSQIESKLVKDIFDGAAGLTAAQLLGKAIIAAIPGDAWASVMAANLHGMPAGRLLKAIFRNYLSSGEDLRKLVAKLGITAYAANTTAIGTKRFKDQLFGQGLFQRLGSFVVHATSLSHWDDALRNTFASEFLATLGDNAGKAFGKLDGAFARFVKDYGFTEDEWNKIAAGQLIEGPAGTKYLLPSSLEEPLRVKLLSAIADTKQFGYVNGGSMRQRALIQRGTTAGTPIGETARRTFLFKAFPISMALTHVVRAAQEARQGRGVQLASLVFGASIMGAITLQARALLTGKDPYDMTKLKFWGAAAVQGAVIGVWADFLSSAFSRSGTSLVETLAGPLARFVTSPEQLLSGARSQVVEGENVNWGSRVANFVKAMTPGSGIWYLDVLFKRYVVDSIRKMLDPDYARSFRREQQRQENEHGQKFYWDPGELAPSRPPNLGAAIGRR
ncbi:MAG: hypothetical protein L0Y60_17845 [Beijerinckiaceae bacterium]|nr:hypothetical protein [Beijerinckiaceae bacterium]